MDARLAAYVASLPPSFVPGSSDPLAGTASPGLSFWQQLRSAGLIRRMAALLGAHVLATVLLLASWASIGFGALSGRLDRGWMAAWALCLASTVPLSLGARWLEGVIGVGFGGLLKQRLLAGAMAMNADAMRRKGAGELLSEVLEAEAIDRLGASGGLAVVLAALELLLVPCVLAWGAAPGVEIALLAGWTSLLVILIVRNTRRRFAWTGLRLELTHRLVEKMTAHRTRLAQQPPSEWHCEEDRETAQYAAVSETLDRSTAVIEAALPRGYVLAAVAVLAPSFFAGSATLGQQAITLGAILFAGAALERLGFGLARGAAAWIAWRSMKPMFDAAAGDDGEGVATDISSPASRLLEAQDVVFTHQGRPEPALKGCSLTIGRGDRLLLKGASGSGKSTFAAVLAGWRRPSAGVILAGGLDLQTLGEQAWRRRIAAAAQYHENHILSASIGFNLLLGRPYPHSPRDLQEARELCEELGLGPLLDRMAGGLDQVVGETGWQLSQGERSRVFLARVLLQDPDLVILDENLGALDPENLRQCLECVIRRAKTLLVIAHS
ncbi:MAG: ABC transporter ATP-binding protein [Acidobacteria bacterium]|nr:ABC transporter ATP-binding protein [Acidobacteriota bacterium]